MAVLSVNSIIYHVGYIDIINENVYHSCTSEQQYVEFESHKILRITISQWKGNNCASSKNLM